MDASTGSAGLGGLVLWFVAIVALIPLSLWFMRRSRWGTKLTAGPVTVVHQTPIGPGQRLLVVEVRHGAHTQTLLLGATAQSIQLITPLHHTPGSVVQETA